MRRHGLEVADIFHRYGTAWRRANVGHLSLGQLQVMSAVENCRSAVLGGHVERCQDCGHRASAADPRLDDIFGQMPELPSLGRRWTIRRKAAVIEAVRGGWVPIEEICRLYNLSVDEFLAWERDIDRYGMQGLRTTRYQIYRDTDAARR